MKDMIIKIKMKAIMLMMMERAMTMTVKKLMVKMIVIEEE